MEIGIFFFVTLTIYNNVHQELPFTWRWEFVYYNDFYTHTFFSCYNRSTDDCQQKVLLALQKSLFILTLVRFLQVKTEPTKKNASGTDNV